MNGISQEQAEASVPTPELDGFVKRIAQANRERVSWLRRLEWVRYALAEANVREDQACLASVAVYLQMLGAGIVPCQEDGRHFRPNHHAELALEIEHLLLDFQPQPNRALVRRVLRWLPSHDAPFRRAEPLTRIRDIAHRSDIPEALKREIKVTLQNKLHRSAGPEDLVTSSRLLERVSRPDAGYSPRFVREFTLFHRELEESFNARSLDGELEGIAPRLHGKELQLVEELRRCLTGSDDDENRLTEELDNNLELRIMLKSALDTVGDSTAQRKRILDGKLEERAFVLLTRLINVLKLTASRRSWSEFVTPLKQALHHAALSSMLVDHCEALYEALEQWRSESSAVEGEHLLRLVALVNLARWIVTEASAELLTAFGQPAALLGMALGITSDRVTGLVEGEVRQSIISQQARLVELLEAKTRTASGASGWQPVATGTAQGRFLFVDSLADVPCDPGPWLLVLERAAGDESLPSSVVGALVRHPLPLVSHLALRARQAGVVMGAGTDVVPKDLQGREGWLIVGASGVTFGDERAEPPAPLRPTYPVMPAAPRLAIALTAPPVESLPGPAPCPARSRRARQRRSQSVSPAGACSSGRGHLARLSQRLTDGSFPSGLWRPASGPALSARTRTGG